MGNCGGCGGRKAVRPSVIKATPRVQAMGASEAIMAAITPRFRVEKPDGTVTQRTWSSIVAATEAARKVGGTVVRD